MRKLLPYVSVAFLFPVLGFILKYQGRTLISKTGKILLWAGNPLSIENSQQISDPYSFSHLQHGLIFYFLVTGIFPKLKTGWQLLIALIIESTWELIENSSYTINKYRTETASLNYEGDSILNSLSDLIFCAVGFFIAKKIGGKYTVTLFLLIELIMIYTIRDSLILNIIMFVRPSKSLLNWQMAQ